jgi:hypothetical protein
LLPAESEDVLELDEVWSFVFILDFGQLEKTCLRNEARRYLYKTINEGLDSLKNWRRTLFQHRLTFSWGEFHAFTPARGITSAFGSGSRRPNLPNYPAHVA